MAVIKKDFTFMSMPKAMNRTNPAPLDSTAVWYSLDELQTYATSGATAYVGQILTLVNEEKNSSTAYIIVDQAGTLQEVGAPTLGDKKTIVLENGTLSLKDFGKSFYKYVPATPEGEAAHYVKTAVDQEHPWVAGLEPRVVNEDGQLVIGWYEPNPTTIEGLNDSITGIKSDISGLKNDTAANKKLLVGESGDAGLVKDVKTLTSGLANVYTKDQTYTQDEINGKVAGVFHFKGTAESLEAVQGKTDAVAGDVWQVGEKEYAYNGSEWVELGFTVDLSKHALKTDVDSAQEAVTALVTAETDARTKAVTGVQGEIDAAELRLVAVEEWNAGERLTAVEGSDATQTEKITALEKAVGADKTPEGGVASGLFAEIDGVDERVATLEAVGAQANKIESIKAGESVLAIAEDKSVSIPVFSAEGATAGLVPVPSALEAPEKNFLNANGEWAIPVDARIGALTFKEQQYNTVEDYVGAAIKDAEMVWQPISNEVQA